METLFIMVLFSLSALFLISSVVFFVLYRIFEYKSHMIEKTRAHLDSTRYRKDVPVYGKRWRIAMIIKNYTKGVYIYTAGKKTYKIHYADSITPRQMPKFVQVIYLKRFPSIAWVSTESSFNKFEIYTFVSVVFFILFALLGVILFL